MIFFGWGSCLTRRGIVNKVHILNSSFFFGADVLEPTEVPRGPTTLLEQMCSAFV